MGTLDEDGGDEVVHRYICPECGREDLPAGRFNYYCPECDQTFPPSEVEVKDVV